MTRLLQFAFVGCVGFAVDSLCFALLWQGLEWSTSMARALAFVVAASTTWLGNRWLTFAERSAQPRLAQWRRALSCAVLAAIPNFAVFQLILMAVGEQGLGPYWALAGGVVAGMGLNYVVSQTWVFTATAEPN